MTLSVIIVNHNSREFVLKCLASIARFPGEVSTEVVVVDTASTDGSAEAIATEFPDRRLLALDKNIGFAAANNAAARETTGEYVLLLNPDTEVLEGSLDRLVEFAEERPEARLWGGRTIYPDGEVNTSSCWRRCNLWSLFCQATGLAALMPWSSLVNWEHYGAWQRDTVRQVDVVSGCFLMLKRSLWQELGGLDPLFFMYGEDVDLCLRARKLGARPLHCPTSTIIHHGGKSGVPERRKMRLLTLARATTIRTHWSRLTKPLGLALLSFHCLRRYLTHVVAARLKPGSTHRETADIFKWLWQTRRDWIRGFQAPQDDASAVT